jgi:drug/metabolite transporter (DMT)-like permease
VALLLAGVASVLYGASDFFGGLATRRAPVLTVVVASQTVGVVGLLAISPFVAPVTGLADFAWGAAGGLVGVIGLALLYHGLGRMSIAVVAPVSAVMGTATPVVYGILVGERPSALAWVGIVIAVAAIVVIALPAGNDTSATGGPRAALVGAAAGTAFGAVGIMLSRTDPDSGLWPLVSLKGTAIAAVLLAALLTRRPVLVEVGRGPAALSGVLDTTATVLFLIAIRMELLSLVAVILAMYPASTVTLGRVVLGERIRPAQVAGMAIGAVAVALIVLG